MLVVRGNRSFWWDWWNCWPSLFYLPFHNIIFLVFLESSVHVSSWLSRSHHFERFTVTTMTWLSWPLWIICVTNDHGYVPLVVNTSRSFPHSLLITGLVARVTRLLPPVEHLSSPPVFSGVRVTWSIALYVCFVDRCLSVCTFSVGHQLTLCCLFFCLLAIVLSVLLSFGHCVVCSSVFWPLCCLFFCLLAIVLSVLLRFTDSDYPCSIFKLFLTLSTLKSYIVISH